MTTPDADPPASETAVAPSRAVRWIAGTAIAAALAVGAALYYGSDVCDEQLTDDGTVVTVCRSLQATDPPIVAVGLIVLFSLTAFFTEISGFGISLKRDVRRATEKADTAISIAAGAESKAAGAENAAESARQTSRVAETVTLDASAHAKGGAVGTSAVLAQVEELAAQYNDIRTLERASDSRTSHMTAVTAKLISVLSGVPSDAFDVDAYLADGQSDGRRLAGFAYLYANPNPILASTLVQAILQERTPFGQYWAIRALRRLISLDPSALDLNSRRELQNFLDRLRPNTNRAYELKQALAEAQNK